MKTHEYSLLRESFERARQSTAADVEELLRELRADHPAVAARLERMLALLEDNRIEKRSDLSTVQPDTATAMIGPYKLLGRIGEGATGVVYLGQQSSPVHRLLAIKLLHPNQATDGNLRRFELEQQILATLDHSGIVTMVGSGIEERGLPYLVMPLVPGVPITEFCRQEELSIEARVKLFASTCRAVQHAHSHGVIHRDLKPGNILVSMVDGAPVSKVIDFGIAKIADSGGRDATSGTQPIGTLRYMCPEQVLCKQPTVQNDVYSLGAVLYEMLTETTVNASNSELEVDAPSLSSERDIPRELDWIVLKAVALEPSRRYSTVNELCDELERFVRGQTVVAGPPAKVYRMMRWLRHRLPLAIAGGVALAAVVVGTGMSLNFAAREHEARENAQVKSDFIAEFFAGLDPYEALGLDTTLLRKRFDRAAQKFNTISDPSVRGDLAGIIGLGYAFIGEHLKALPLLEEAESLTRKGEVPDDVRLRTLAGLVRVHCEADHLENGLPYLEEIRSLACVRLNDDRKCLEAKLLEYRVRKASAVELLALAGELASAIGANDPLTITAERMYARRIFPPILPEIEAHREDSKLAREAVLAERAKATAILKTCRERAMSVFGLDHPFVVEDIAMEAWGMLDGELGAGGVVAFASEWLPRTEGSLRPLHRTTMLLRGNLAKAYSLLGQHEEADKESQRALSDADTHWGPISEVCEQIRRGRIEILQRAGRHDDAIAMAHELDELRDKKNPESARILAEVYEAAGRAADAELWWAEFEKRQRELGGQDSK